MEENKIKSTASEESNKFVKTYAEDMASVLESDKEGLVKKIIHGEEEHEQEKKNLSPESKKNRLFMLIGFVLIFLALLILSYFLFKKEDINTVAVQKQFIPLIFNDKSEFVEILGLNKDEVVETILSQVNDTEVKIGGIKGIYLTENKQIIGLRRFITIIKGNFVPGEDKLFVDDNFLMGSMLTGLKSSSPTAGPARPPEGAGGDFFILLKTRSTADIFSQLRVWEEKMLADLHKFAGIDLSAETNYLFTKDFEDGVIENKNARILHNKDGGIVLMYIFADENSVIITSSELATHEIILRLASSEKKQ
ncbi:hypothetical protein A2121_01495 [Candidatus Nomurabacteria bacterium GWB1_40_6]|uniref:Uncharacterized protein n=1 Tax=Candidatus Nomurabacteria bacterium GWB1_40_6 TaxID=1801727 RepID=A0A1F6TN24_9BACT|nr:MAG: hypothetical protein A2121_01495 [Candidatus Nomurabacteria bacterium GWB1_40_6]